MEVEEEDLSDHGVDRYMDLVDNSRDSTDDDNTAPSDRDVNIASEDEDEDEMDEDDPFSEPNGHRGTSMREMMAENRRQT